MGVYLNPGNTSFQRMLNSEIYVDHSLLIEQTNKVFDTEDNKLCVSRPRRFGKSTDAYMLAAYYSKGCDSSSLFDHLKISQTSLYKTYLNKHNVIYLNTQSFLSSNQNIDEMVQDINESVIYELLGKYNDLHFMRKNILSRVLSQIHSQTGEQFVFIIDEWDCIFREHKQDKEAQKKYLDFLRLLLKDQPYVSLAYMTGILPIKKYGTHSALNMFDEISMIDSMGLSEFMGFSEMEVKNLCQKYDVDFTEMKRWYDGYHLTDTISTFSPRSVVASIIRKNFSNYWTSTETYEALQIYIDMNFDGLRDDIVKLLAGEKIYINTAKFQNDMTTFTSKDDVMTLLVHLGYLGYDRKEKKVYIPNKEVTDSFVNSIEASDWQETTKALVNSRELLEATWRQDERKVAKYIEECHLHTSILQYNDENALSYTLSLAYYTARDYYTVIREMPSGKGYADMVFIPKEDKPAMIIELKWNQEANTAIQQIRNKEYYHGLEKYLDRLLLIGISYDKKTKEHQCLIEKYMNDE